MTWVVVRNLDVSGIRAMFEKAAKAQGLDGTETVRIFTRQYLCAIEVVKGTSLGPVFEPAVRTYLLQWMPDREQARRFQTIESAVAAALEYEGAVEELKP